MEGEEDGVKKKITIGVCVMEKKVKCGSEAFSAPMLEILERLESFGEFEIVYFGDKVILEEPIERWPICECLIAFYSSGYPLQRAEAYAALRKPFLVNELEQQHLLHDRRKVYERLEMFGIPVPRYALVNREFPNQELDYFVEEEDFVEVHGDRFWKPFVEKPVDGKIFMDNIIEMLLNLEPFWYIMVRPSNVIYRSSVSQLNPVSRIPNSTSV